MRRDEMMETINLAVIQSASGDLFIGEGLPPQDYMALCSPLEIINKNYQITIYFGFIGLSWLEIQMLLVIVNDWLKAYGSKLAIGTGGHLVRQPFPPANDNTTLATVIDPSHRHYGAQVKVSRYRKSRNDFLGEYFWMESTFPAIDIFRPSQLGDVYPSGDQE